MHCSIRGLKISEASTKPKKLVNIRNVNYDAGADVLHHFQMEWNNLHELSEENAQKGQEADALIASIHEKLDLQWSSIATLNNTLSSIPQINNTIQALMDQIGKTFKSNCIILLIIIEYSDCFILLRFSARGIRRSGQCNL